MVLFCGADFVLFTGACTPLLTANLCHTLFTDGSDWDLRMLAAADADLCLTACYQVMFSQLVHTVVSSQPLLQFIDVLWQGTSGAPAAALPVAYMVRAFSQMYQPGESFASNTPKQTVRCAAKQYTALRLQ
jgi:hypothetical protein